MFRIIPINSSKKHLIRFSLNSVKQNSSANTHSSARLGAQSVTAHAGGDHHHAPVEFDRKSVYPRIGNREIVGFGKNGDPQYFDHFDSPCPAIRWKEDTAEIKKLREKARADWKDLSIEEKKALYRADFRITFAELDAPTGEWKFTLGFILAFLGASLWIYAALRRAVYNYPALETSSLEHQNRMLERMIAEGVGRVHGSASEWDYEKGDWKANTKSSK